MRIHDQKLAKAGSVNRLADLDHCVQKQIAGERHGPGKMQVLVRLAIGDRRQGIRGNIVRQDRQGAAHHARRDDAVDSARQVRSMLFDRAGGQHNDRVLAVGQPVDLDPAQVG